MVFVGNRPTPTRKENPIETVIFDLHFTGQWDEQDGEWTLGTNTELEATIRPEENGTLTAEVGTYSTSPNPFDPFDPVEWNVLYTRSFSGALLNVAQAWCVSRIGLTLAEQQTYDIWTFEAEELARLAGD